MQLFDDFQRTYMGYQDPHESIYAFLKRSARPEYEQVRNVLESWFRDIPNDSHYALQRSFRSDDQRHLGAFFEIYCHTLLKKQNFSVDLQQVVDQTSGNPIDFLARTSESPLFYLEATVALDSGNSLKSQRHLHQLKEALNTLNEPFFRIILEVKQESRYSLPARQIRNEIHQWLQTLDPDEISQKESTQGHDSMPYCSWLRDEWNIVFIAIPRPREERGQAGETVLYEISAGRWNEGQNGLRRTLEDKADKYGTFQLPFVIAVDVLALNAIGCDLEEVFFGQDVVLVNLESDEAFSTRSPLLPNRPYDENGFWLARRGPRNQQVSAVLLIDELIPWSLAHRTPILWHNPWAEKPLSPDIWQGPQMLQDPANMVSVQWSLKNGKKGGELLQLSPNWPHEESAISKS